MDATATELEPVARRIPAPIAAPMIVLTDPDVVDTALAVTRSAWSTRWGNAADNADRKNRLTPSATTAVTKNATPSEFASTRPATTRTRATLTVFATTSTRWRRHRSRNTPTNGPATEYGRSRAANAAAALAGVVAFCGEKKT